MPFLLTLSMPRDCSAAKHRRMLGTATLLLRLLEKTAERVRLDVQISPLKTIFKP